MKAPSWALRGLVLLAVAGCASADKSTRPAAIDVRALELSAAPRREGVRAVLAVMPPSTATLEVHASLAAEISADFDLVTLQLNEEVTVETLAKKIEEVDPACLVLMNNTTVKLYRAYQRSRPADTTFPPAVVVMTAYLEELKGGLINTTGIAYEVPAATIFRNLRMFLDRPVDRVGVVYRKSFARFVARQERLAAPEHIELFGVEVDDDASARSLKQAIEELREVHHVDALWVLNDNHLLGKPNMFAKGWLPMLEDEPLPIVVGVGSLVRGDHTFGNFAMLPDHAALGVQASNIIFELAAEDWNAADRGIEQPISIQTVISLTAARENLRFKEEMLGRIDRIVE